jgi:hypothetical protein
MMPAETIDHLIKEAPTGSAALPELAPNPALNDLAGRWPAGSLVFKAESAH